jgi:hypothetical protein
MSVKSKGVSLKWFKGYDVALLGDIHLQQVGNHVVKMDADGKPKMAFSDTDITWGYPGSLLGTMESNYGTTVSWWDLERRTVEPVHVPHQKAFDHQGFRRISQPKLVIYRQASKGSRFPDPRAD